MMSREAMMELQGLLDEADFWVRQTSEAEWRLFSRVYDTRGSFLKASKKAQSILEKAMTEVNAFNR
jgi:hypothetical protein